MPSAVLQIIAAGETSPPVRQAAAVYLKNRVARSWTGPSKLPGNPDGASTSTVPVAESDRQALKDNILHVLVNTPQQNVKVQLKTCLATMTCDDFPEKWPGLMESVMAMIQSGQENQMEGGLLALIEVLKIYRSVAIISDIRTVLSFHQLVATAGTSETSQIEYANRLCLFSPISASIS